jgi:hypothetical protein
VSAARDRAAHLAVRLANKAAQATAAFSSLLDEVPLALYTPALERITNERYYARNREYVGDSVERTGFFPYETEALDRDFPPPPARLLVHGAGGGRETLALLQRGYRVDAFEPVASMAAHANRILAPNGGAVRQASLQEWSANPTGAYDGIFNGWDMWTHMMRHDERVAALRAFRAVSDGPVLLSFLHVDANINETEYARTHQPLHPRPIGAKHILRVGLRERLLRLPPLERGTDWDSGGYVHRVSEPELREEAGCAGYRVTYYERDFERYGCAVLRPETARSDA